MPRVTNQNPHSLIPHRSQIRSNATTNHDLQMQLSTTNHIFTATSSTTHQKPLQSPYTVWIITGQRKCEDFEFWAQWPPPNVSCTTMLSPTLLELHHSARCWLPNLTTLSARHRNRLSKKVMPPPPLSLAGWPSLCSLVLLLLAPRSLLLMQLMEKLVFTLLHFFHC